MDGQMESLLLYFFNKKMLLKVSSAKVFLALGTPSQKRNPIRGRGLGRFPRGTQGLPFLPPSQLPMTTRLLSDE